MAINDVSDKISVFMAINDVSDNISVSVAINAVSDTISVFIDWYTGISLSDILYVNTMTKFWCKCFKRVQHNGIHMQIVVHVFDIDAVKFYMFTWIMLKG